ncbi:MAG: hypothetical protein JSR18_07780 [Proteobacteria bacterium]|nr:hypothetical protein [Pseudomonadota bacterium]
MNARRRSLVLLAPLLAAAAAIDSAGCATRFPEPDLPLRWTGNVARLEVYDRPFNETKVFYRHGGELWMEGKPGTEFGLWLRNVTNGRILVVASIDGVNIITGETASPDQTGYVLEPGQLIAVDGWRKSYTQTAAFYFSDVRNSYAARTGRPNDVGVIGLAVFRERAPVAYRPRAEIGGTENGARGATEPQQAQAPASNAPTDSVDARPAAPRRDAAKAEGSFAQAAPAPAPSLGTGHGRTEYSTVQRVDFVRATPQPAEVLTVRYDRRENLVAMGVLPPSTSTSRAPDPFPGMRFAPDPR